MSKNEFTTAAIYNLIPLEYCIVINKGMYKL